MTDYLLSIFVSVLFSTLFIFVFSILKKVLVLIFAGAFLATFGDRSLMPFVVVLPYLCITDIFVCLLSTCNAGLHLWLFSCLLL